MRIHDFKWLGTDLRTRRGYMFAVVMLTAIGVSWGSNHFVEKCSDGANKAQLLLSSSSAAMSGLTISASSEPYIDKSARRISIDDSQPPCVKGELVVPVRLSTDGSRSLSSIKVVRIWAHQDGNWWSAKTADEKIENVPGGKSVVAQGCAVQPLNATRPIDVILKLTDGEQTSYVRAASKRLVDGKSRGANVQAREAPAFLF